MAALATLERVWPSHDISYVKGCVMVWDIAWHSYMAADILVIWDILQVNHHDVTP